MSSLSNNDEKWKQKKEEWKNKLEELEIPEELNGKISYYESELDKLNMQARWEYQELKSKLDKVNSIIKEVKKMNKDKGSNREQREANAMRHVTNYNSSMNPGSGDTINLLDYKRKIKKRVTFYEDYVLAVIKDKSKRLMANIGAMKVEAQVTSNTEYTA